MTIARVIDFETTGLPEPGSEVIEWGFCDVFLGEDGRGIPQAFFTSGFCGASKPIPPETSAVHHIVDADIAGKPPFAGAVARDLLGDAEVFVAHNAAFERHFFETGGIPWICTYRAAMRLWPDAPGHSNQVLRYWLGVECDRDLANATHRAGPDAYVTARIFARMLQLASVVDLVRWTSEPLTLHRVAFGKHKGLLWSEVPRDYLEWILRQPAGDFDPDVIHTCRHHLAPRALPASPPAPPLVEPSADAPVEGPEAAESAKLDRQALAAKIALEAAAIKIHGRNHGLTDGDMKPVFDAVNAEWTGRPALDRLAEIESRIDALIDARKRLASMAELPDEDDLQATEAEPEAVDG